jgi:hypothetical protein
MSRPLMDVTIHLPAVISAENDGLPVTSPFYSSRFPGLSDNSFVSYLIISLFKYTTHFPWGLFEHSLFTHVLFSGLCLEFSFP